MSEERTLTEDLETHRGRVSPEKRPVLLVVSHPESDRIGERVELGTSPMVIGRTEPTFDGGPLGDRRMSSKHAVAEVRGDELHLRDGGSKNGSFSAAGRVDELSLKAGDFVQLGRTFLQFQLEAPFDWRAPTSGLYGISEGMHHLRESVRAAARHDRPVLIVGPTGAGKEPTAREIHRLSGRRGEWVALNVASLPSDLVESELFGHVAGAFTGAQRGRVGLFSRARQGTLFLDEIGEMPAELQPKLLRAIQERAIRPVGGGSEERVDARVVSATLREPEALVRDGQFRADLYARLSADIVRVPPLSEHPEDIIGLAHHLAQRGRTRLPPLSAALTWALLEHPWPLNVRALENLVLTAAAEAHEGTMELTPRIEAALDAQRSLGDAARARPNSPPSRGGHSDDAAPKRRRRAPSKEAIVEVMTRHEGVLSSAARELGVHRYQLYRWLESHQLEADSFRPTDE